MTDPDLSQTGSEIHEAKIESTRIIAGRRYSFIACECGWEGPARETADEAIRDFAAHLQSRDSGSDA